MQLPLQITYRGLDPSPAVDADIRDKAAKLDHYYDHIMSCRVMVEAPHRHSRQGNIYHVRVDLKVPDRELVASRDTAKYDSHEDLYVAIRDAFAAIQRQLEDYARHRRGDTKTHEVPSHGRVAQLYPEEGYGIIEDSEGRKIYFHRNSVLGDAFGSITVGSEIRFAEEMGDKGPQASTVRVIGKHHL
jgi:ribosomal subunit interface protein